MDELPLVQVNYSLVWKERHAYFQALQARGEVSARAHALTADLIELNGANYTAWAWRMRCTQAAVAAAAAEAAEDSSRRCAPLFAELRFTEEYAESNAKNYQLWNHRRLVAAALAEETRACGGGTAEAAAEAAALVGGREDAFTAAVLGGDEKNYHAWSHRSWAVAAFGLFERELAFTEELLSSDGRNNSAWNARYSALARLGAQPTPRRLGEEEAARELQLAAWHISCDPANEAAWAYARGIAATSTAAQALLQDIATETLAAHPVNTHAACVLGDAAEARALASRAAGGEDAAAAAEAGRLFRLCCEHDPIRAQYWTFRAAASAAEYDGGQ